VRLLDRSSTVSGILFWDDQVLEPLRGRLEALIRSGESTGKRCHNKDQRPDLYQMAVGMALDVEDPPICCEMWPGNTADVKTLHTIVKRMRKRFRLREITVVADRGMASKATLQKLMMET
jgi:transposase